MKKMLALVALVAMLTPTAFAADAAKVNVSALNVRADADISATLLGKLILGTVVQVEGKVLKDTWCRISYKSREAYVACEYLTFSAAAPAPATPAPEATTPAVTKPAPAATATFPLTRVVTVPTLNVRAMGSLAGELLGRVTMGTNLQILEKSQDNWCRIEFTGKVAWVSCMYVAKAADMPEPKPETPAPVSATGSTMTPKVTTDAGSAGAGCMWTEKDFGALTMNVKQCGANGVNYGVRGNGVYKFTTSIDTPAGDPILELYAKGESEPVQDAVMSLVSTTIPQEEQGKCVVRKAASDLSDASKEVYALLPTAEYQQIIDERKANETNVTACGAYGLGAAKQYFEYHPAESKTIFAFVRADGSFEPNSIKIR